MTVTMYVSCMCLDAVELSELNGTVFSIDAGGDDNDNESGNDDNNDDGVFRSVGACAWMLLNCQVNYHIHKSLLRWVIKVLNIEMVWVHMC